MSTCPNGHASTADDYCDVCGTRIGGAPSTVGPGSSTPPVPTGTPAAPEPARPGTSTDTSEVSCPHCGITQDGGHKFCEVCGADMSATPATTPTGAPAAAPAVLVGPEPTAPPAPAAPTSAPAPATPTPATGDVWELTVEADRAWFDRQAADGVTFPLAQPTRSFSLADATVLVGRRSDRRGIVPQVDLTGGVEDPGISHAHCSLLRQPDGSYALVDSGSTNGTFVNDGTGEIARDVPVPLADEDRIHLGAWTTITIRRRARVR